MGTNEGAGDSGLFQADHALCYRRGWQAYRGQVGEESVMPCQFGVVGDFLRASCEGRFCHGLGRDAEAAGRPARVLFYRRGQSNEEWEKARAKSTQQQAEQAPSDSRGPQRTERRGVRQSSPSHAAFFLGQFDHCTGRTVSRATSIALDVPRVPCIGHGRNMYRSPELETTEESFRHGQEWRRKAKGAGSDGHATVSLCAFTVSLRIVSPGQRRSHDRPSPFAAPEQERSAVGGCLLLELRTAVGYPKATGVFRAPNEEEDQLKTDPPFGIARPTDGMDPQRQSRAMAKGATPQVDHTTDHHIPITGLSVAKVGHQCTQHLSHSSRGLGAAGYRLQQKGQVRTGTLPSAMGNRDNLSRIESGPRDERPPAQSQSRIDSVRDSRPRCPVLLGAMADGRSGGGVRDRPIAAELLSRLARIRGDASIVGKRQQTVAACIVAEALKTHC